MEKKQRGKLKVQQGRMIKKKKKKKDVIVRR